jgi:hypothetical protein
MLCLVCGKNEAIKDKFLGIIPCLTCQLHRYDNKLPNPVEFTSKEIKSERIKYADDILQPFRQGELSREYVDKHGTNNLNVTESEIKKSKKVWD